VCKNTAAEVRYGEREGELLVSGGRQKKLYLLLGLVEPGSETLRAGIEDGATRVVTCTAGALCARDITTELGGRQGRVKRTARVRMECHLVRADTVDALDDVHLTRVRPVGANRPPVKVKDMVSTN
jgi:hypothetical protein